MPYCPICEKCLCGTGRKGSHFCRKNTLASSLRRHKALTLSGREDKTSNKFGGGIISTKCGHLFHQNCLNEYITNYRTKGDCYGTTYNVLCPICGANLSNGKTLKIDIEAHFGILEEFFQDLCKLKYMNKELKRTLELEWTDISDLEKKIEVAKSEYDSIKSLKRSNEQRCIAQEERIAKAIEDASTCYRYREIEKQLLDENINLEAVARRMETIINAKLKSKRAPPSSSASTQTETSETGIDQEQEPEMISIGQICKVGNYQDLIDAAVNSTILSSESTGDEEAPLTQRVQGHVDISVQISVHSEWSLNSERSVASETLLKKRSSNEGQAELCSSASLSSECIAMDKRLNKNNSSNIHRCQFPSTVQFESSQEVSARKIDEWARENADGNKTVGTNRVHRTIQYEKQQKKLIAIQTNLNSPDADKSKSYTVRTFPNILPAEMSNSEKSGRELVCKQPMEAASVPPTSKRPEKVEDETHADKSRSYTIQIHDPNANVILPPDDYLSIEPDPLLQALLSQGEDNTEAPVVKHKPPKPVSCRSVRREFFKHSSTTIEESSSQVNPLVDRTTDENPPNSISEAVTISSETLRFKAESKQEFKLQLSSRQLSDLSEKRSDRRCNLTNKKTVITPPNMFAEFTNANQSELDQTNGLHLTICHPPPPLELHYKKEIKSGGSSKQHRNSSYRTNSRETKVESIAIKNGISRPDRLFDDLVVPPPPASNSNIPEHFSLVVPPPPPMSARSSDSPYRASSQTPESTRRLIESLLTPEMNLTLPSTSSGFENTRTNPTPRPILQAQRARSKPKKTPESQRSRQDNSIVTDPSLPPPPKMFTEESDEDELLKSVINQATSSIVTVPILEANQAETGAAGDIPDEPREKDSDARMEMENTLPNSPTPMLPTGVLSSVPALSREYQCLAAERFAKDSCFQNSLQSSLQSVKVGAEPAEDNANYDSYQKRSGVIETIEYFYKPNQTRCVTPRTYSSSVYRRSDYRLDNYSNYWAFENSVCTPIVVEHGPEQFTNQGDFITPETSYTILHGVNTGPQDRWLPDSKVSLPSLHENQPSHHHVQFYPRFNHGHNYP